MAAIKKASVRCGNALTWRNKVLRLRFGKMRGENKFCRSPSLRMTELFFQTLIFCEGMKFDRYGYRRL